MNQRFRLADVLRVRRIQEDVANARVARARADAEAVDGLVSRRQQRLAERQAPRSGSVGSFVNEMIGLRVMAGEIDAARLDAARVRDALTVDIEKWSAARARTRALERLEERHDEQVAAHLLRVAQAEIDDLVAARQVRAAAARYDTDGNSRTDGTQR